MNLTIFQLLNGLTFAALLFIVASGFTLIFGLMRIVNLAHGAFYLLGGYLAYWVATWSGSFWVGIVGAALLVASLGWLEQKILRLVKGVELHQVLLSLGLALMINDASLVAFGGDTLSVPIPDVLKGPMPIFGMLYPKYRLFVF